MPHALRIGVLDAQPSGGTLRERLGAIGEAVRTMAGRADLLLFPQLALAGTCADAEEAAEAAELSDGPGPRELCRIAAAAGVGICCGYAEHCTGNTYDATIVVDHRGRALGNYRRTHFRPGVDDAGFSPGHWLTLVPMGEARLGLLLGADLVAPETARSLVLAGAGILLAGSRDDAAALPLEVLRSRAFENGCGLAFANGSQDPAAPRSCIVGPDGAILAVAPRGGAAVAELPVRLAGSADRLGARRPRLYQNIVLPVAGEAGPRL